MGRRIAPSAAALQRWADRVAQTLEQRWPVSGLARGLVVESSTRMTRSLGRCYPARGLIRLNAVLTERAHRAMLLETLVHELAHLASYRLGAREKPHGPAWRDLMRRAGFPDRASIPAGIGPAPPSPRRPRFRHRCRSCGNEFLRRRTDRRWRCAVCLDAGRGGVLDIERLP